jgi:hypothetical protein
MKRRVSDSRSDIFAAVSSLTVIIWAGGCGVEKPPLSASPVPDIGNSTPGIGNSTPDGVSPGVSGSALVDVARLYLDQPAERFLYEKTATPPPADVAPDLESTTWLSRTGELMGSRIQNSRGCTGEEASALTGRRLLVPSQHATIQAAIDAAVPGDVVSVAPGVYHEHVHLRSSVSLVGDGAWQTILDGDGAAQSLVDYTGARNAVIQGFTLRDVGLAEGCASPLDPFFCSGNWYAAAIYGDGRQVEPDLECPSSSILVTQNIIRDNVLGMMAYFHAQAVVRNNVFLDNRFAVVANHMQDHALILNNVFVNNAALAIGSQAAYLDVIGNIVASSAVGVEHEFVQQGRISCNVFVAVDNPGTRVPIGTQGNVTATEAFLDAAHGDFRPTAALIAQLAPCLGEIGGLADFVPWLSQAPGAFGGALGSWFGSSVAP